MVDLSDSKFSIENIGYGFRKIIKGLYRFIKGVFDL